MTRHLASAHNSKLMILATAKRRRLRRKISAADAAFDDYIHLADEGFLDGWISLAENGQPIQVADLKITPKGEDFLDEHERLELPRPITLNKQVYVLMECLAAYVVVLMFFVVVKLHHQPGKASPEPGAWIERAPQPKEPKWRTASHLPFKSTFGVCGLPPQE